MTATIEEAWRALAGAAVRPAHIAMSSTYPIELFAQVDTADRPGLLAISDVAPDRPPPYSAFEITVGRRADGRWATSIALAQPSLSPQFATMCGKVIEYGALQPSGADASLFLLQQVARWHRMLTIGTDGLLSLEEQRGLLGELIVLQSALGQFDADAAVTAWVGPDDAPQDFAFPSCYIEVKTTITGSPMVSINSLGQLDIADGVLQLAVVEVIQCANGTGGHSLRGVVDQLLRQLENEVSARSRFVDQLAKTGYVDRDEYGVVEYRVVRARWFKVDGSFPRLARSLLPLSIVEARYQLLLAALTDYEIDAFGNHGRT